MSELVGYVFTVENFGLLLLTGFIWVMWRADGFN